MQPHNACKHARTNEGQARELGGGGDVHGEAGGRHEDELADVLRVEADEVDGDGAAHGGAHDVVGPGPQLVLQSEEELRQLPWVVGGVVVLEIRW